MNKIKIYCLLQLKASFNWNIAENSHSLPECCINSAHPINSFNNQCHLLYYGLQLMVIMLHNSVHYPRPESPLDRLSQPQALGHPASSHRVRVQHQECLLQLLTAARQHNAAPNIISHGVAKTSHWQLTSPSQRILAGFSMVDVAAYLPNSHGLWLSPLISGSSAVCPPGSSVRSNGRHATGCCS